MLTKPRCGWSNITIGDWTDVCSYLDDVPFMLLESLEESCREHKPVAVRFDAEGYEYTIVFDWLHTHIITDSDDGYRLTTIQVDRDDIAKELVEDIRRDIKEWSEFIDYGDMTDDQKSERIKDLRVLCDVLEKRLPSNDWELVYSKDGSV